MRLTVDDDTDIAALFAKARRMQPGRLVVGEVHREEMRHFFALLAEMPTVGGMATLRADTVHRAVDAMVKAVGDGDPAAGRARPGGRCARSSSTCTPTRRAGRASPPSGASTASQGDELELEEVRTAAPAAARLVAEA